VAHTIWLLNVIPTPTDRRLSCHNINSIKHLGWPTVSCANEFCLSLSQSTHQHKKGGNNTRLIRTTTSSVEDCSLRRTYWKTVVPKLSLCKYSPGVGAFQSQVQFLGAGFCWVMQCTFPAFSKISREKTLTTFLSGPYAFCRTLTASASLSAEYPPKRGTTAPPLAT